MVKLALVHPQEVEAHYILPAIRAQLAQALKALGREQKAIAQLLGVSEPAVSQYLAKERGSEVRFTQTVKQAIKDVAAKLKDRLDFIRETQRLLKLILNERITCKVHERFGSVPKGCDVCFTK